MNTKNKENKMPDIIIVDYGSQYTQLIKSHLRGLGYDAKIVGPHSPNSDLGSPEGIILSGGPSSVYEEGAPQITKDLARLIFTQATPTLAICYGLQAISHYVSRGRYPVVAKMMKKKMRGGEEIASGEYGKTVFEISSKTGVLRGLKDEEIVWMSHGDEVFCLPPGFKQLASTKNCRLAAMQHATKPIYGLQFHPEVSHTLCGDVILKNFLDICAVQPNWSNEKELERMKRETKKQIGSRHVFAFISCGNDSSVLARFLQEIVPKKRLHFFYVRGLGSDEDLKKIPLVGGVFHIIDARRRFLGALKNVIDPEEKRKIIGKIFVKIWKEETRKLSEKIGGDADDFVLAQGTIHPDIIEHGGSRHSHVIKTHHNRVKEIQDLLKVGGVIEPFSNLFKEDVRQIGRILGVEESLITQHPSPGPGYAVRFLCSDNDLIPRDDKFKEAMSCENEIQEMCKQAGYMGWVLPIKSKGVQGDQGTYAYTVGIIGSHNSENLTSLANDLTNRFKGKINRVVCLVAPSDATSLQFVGLKKDYFRAYTRDIVDKANTIFIKNLRISGIYPLVSQAFAVACPLSFPEQKSHRGYSVILRAVDTEDYMTASPHCLPWPNLCETAKKIMHKIPEVQIVFYDLTSKPPGTIEWE